MGISIAEKCKRWKSLETTCKKRIMVLAPFQFENFLTIIARQYGERSTSSSSLEICPALKYTMYFKAGNKFAQEEESTW